MPGTLSPGTYRPVSVLKYHLSENSPEGLGNELKSKEKEGLKKVDLDCQREGTPQGHDQDKPTDASLISLVSAGFIY